MAAGGDAIARLGSLESGGRHGLGPRGRGGPPVLVLLAIVLVPAVALLGIWRIADGRRAEPDALELRPDGQRTGPRTVELRTGILSFRRVPEVLAGAVRRDRFTTSIDRFAATVGDRSCVTVSLDGVEVSGGRGADVAVIPASALKIVVGAVALERLGAEHRFTTTLTGNVEDGVVTGDLAIVGGGDPLLTSDAYPVEGDTEPVFNETSLDALADALVEAGVTRVAGNIVGDGSRYDDELYAPDWVPADRGVEAGPIGALSVNDARVTGEVSRSADPAQGAAAELAQVLAARGIAVDGDAVPGVAAQGAAELASVRSVPLPGVVAEMLTNSDNNTAEMLLKELGRGRGGTGSREAGLAVVREQLGAWGADLDLVTLTDASGLSTTNQVTCSVLQTVLVDSGHAAELASGMAVAGESGTLSDVFVGSPVAGRLVAKTGTLANAPFDADPPAAKGLAGYLPVAGGERIAFTLLLNGPAINDQAAYQPIWDGLVAALAEYPSGPSPKQLAPRR